MRNFDIEKMKKILSKDMDKKSLNKAIKKIEEKYQSTLEIFNVSTWDHLGLEEKVNVLMALGFGRDRTIEALSEYKMSRDHIKKARESMNDEQTKFRLENESFLTNTKIESTKRRKRMKFFEEANVEWPTIAKRYIEGESLHKLVKEYGLKPNTITDQLKDDGSHDETRSTLLKNKKASTLENTIDDDFIINLIKENPLDSKDLWWEKSKEEYPWLLRKQMFDKLKELGLERTGEEVNNLRRIKNELIPGGVKPKREKKGLNISPQEVKANTIEKVDKVFGSLGKLVELYMSNKLGSYSKISKYINGNCEEGLKVSVRQVEKVITRHSNYIPKKSRPQTQLYEFVRSSFPNYEIIEEHTIPGTQKRIDVFIKALNVGLEFNGDYWHSDEVILYNYGKTAKDTHKKRVEDARRAGIKLVYVWERDWNINFLEVENAIVNQDWDSPLLNRYSNSDYHRKVKAPKIENHNSKKQK